MRAITFLLLAVFIHPSCKNSTANVELQNEKEVRKALTKKWEATYMETVGSRSKVPEEQVTNIVFDENGTYSTRVKNGNIVNNGEWSYNPKTQFLYMGTEKEKRPGRVLKLTGNELIMAEYWLMNDKIVDSIVVTYKRI